MERDVKTMIAQENILQRQDLEVVSRVLGWISCVQVKRKTAYLSISRLVFMGACLNRSQKLYSYLVQDNNGRDIVLTFLDGNPKDNVGRIEKLGFNTFLHVNEVMEED
jgi:hypothetical protein